MASASSTSALQKTEKQKTDERIKAQLMKTEAASAPVSSPPSRPSARPAASSSSSSAPSLPLASSPPPRGATPSSSSSSSNSNSITPRSATKTMGGVDKAKFAPSIPARRRSVNSTTALGGVGASPAQSLLNPRVKHERGKRERKAFVAAPKEKARVSFMAPSREKVKMEAGATLSASQMTGGNKGTSGVKIENVKEDEDIPVGSYYSEDSRLDNGDAQQYRPILMPFPDIRGEEVRYSVEEAEAEHQRWKLDPNDTTIDEPKWSHGGAQVKVKQSLYAPMSASYPPLAANNWFGNIPSDKVSSRVFFLQMPSHFPIKLPPQDTKANPVPSSLSSSPSPPPPSPSPPPGKKSALEAKTKGGAAAASPSPEPKKSPSPSPEPVQVPDDDDVVDPRLVALEKKDVSSLNPEQKKLLQDQKAYLQSISKLFNNRSDHSLKNAMPAGGQVGTMYVYRSGKIKLKIGDLTYQMSRGTDQLFHQELVSMPAPGSVTGTTAEMYSLGSITKRVVCTLDTEAVLQSVETAAQLAAAVVVPPNASSD